MRTHQTSEQTCKRYSTIFIDNDTVRTVTTSQTTGPSSPNKCSSAKVNNVAFIKTHKTASTTVTSIFNRYGFLNNLSFVLNKKIPLNGHFYYTSLSDVLEEEYFLPPRGKIKREFNDFKFNISSVHVLYNRTIFETFMDNRTKYVTILRNPVDQFVSAFKYFTFNKVVGVNNTEAALELFMQNPKLYRNKFGRSSAMWKYSRNNQMFDLGLEHSWHDNITIVKDKLEKLDEEFDFILIGDYLDESLLILRKMFCWRFEDIMYASQNRRKDKQQGNKELHRNVREWNSVDVMLYDHFNQSLWKRIANYEGDFQQDLAHLRNLNQQLIGNCTSGEVTKLHFRGFKQRKYKLTQNASILCKLVFDTRNTLFTEIWDVQNTSYVN
ncbi:galactose-3-O-sulfotransferase 3-like [Antedon mediterranea]|uniref:galactose-3-O-sulfotransferase 3-like n=1 Tax=Antedon mediterranea TaxID=105859 RepID=UPI003AF68653